jgi:hypothetical protein
VRNLFAPHVRNPFERLFHQHIQTAEQAPTHQTGLGVTRYGVYRRGISGLFVVIGGLVGEQVLLSP